MNALLKCFVFLLVAIVTNCVGELVSLDQGELIGKIRKDRNGDDFYSFLSVPYAAPPIGSLRFADPLPPNPWEGVLNATTDLPSCPQSANGEIVGQEDCLYLNIHTPKLPTNSESDQFYPVIIFIHGGSLIEGSGSTTLYDAKFLMPAKVVLVTINYRLGLLGFLNSPDRNLMVPGNFGIKDQIMALQWVAKNIQKFSGDPKKVTLMGHSAGGATAHAHMFSKFSKGMFHRVISMSGVIASQYGRGFRDSMRSVADRLGIKRNSSEEVLEELRNLPAQEIVQAQANEDILVPISQPIETSPNLEYNYPNALIPIDPAIQLERRNVTKVPFMLGYTDNEGLFAQVVTRLATGKPFVVDNFEMFIPYNLKLNPREKERLKRGMKRFYFGNEEPSVDNLEKSNKLVRDAVIIAGISEILKRQSTQNRRMFLYRFSGDTKLNFFKRMSNFTADAPGACHVDDLGYIFNHVFTPEIQPGSPEDLAITTYVNLITSFAKNGYPDPNVHWQPFTLGSRSYLSIEGDTLKPKVHPDNDTFKFWFGVYNKYGRRAHFVG